MYATTKQWVFNTISLLPEREMEQLKDYLEFLVWKTQSHQLEEKTPAQKIIEAVEQSYEVTMDDALALLKTIKDNQIPVRFNSPFNP